MQIFWSELESFCPGIHLAQMHSHLSWHQKEINLAFGDWLPKLKEIKAINDPSNLMPSLSS